MIKPLIFGAIALVTGGILFFAGKAKAADEPEDDEQPEGLQQGEEAPAAASGSTKPKSTKPRPPKITGTTTVPTTPTKTGKSLEIRVAEAVASESPRIMREVADQLEREGFKDAADSLRREAERIEAGNRIPKDPPVPEAPPVRSPGLPTSSTSKPIELPEMVVTPEDPRRIAAQRLTSHLVAIGGLAGRFKEDKSLVSSYQKGENLTVDGKYGPGTSISILERHGIIPVAPYYWSKTNWKQQKATYIATVRRIASGDPARSAQYEKLIADTNRS